MPTKKTKDKPVSATRALDFLMGRTTERPDPATTPTAVLAKYVADAEVVKAPAPADEVMTLVANIADQPDLTRGIDLMMERAGEFKSPMTAMLAGIAIDPAARDFFDGALDSLFSDYNERPLSNPQEVIIGGGLHAAIYCAVRVAKGFAPPLVIEASDRAGGAFAVSRDPSFYLNSRNRPGALSIPGRGDGALNVLPGGPIQPSDLSGDEYQRNSDIAYAIRCSLAMNATVLTGSRVESIGPNTSGGKKRYEVTLANGRDIKCNRIVNATGLGRPRRLGEGHERVLTFPEFMATLDQTFPLRGLRSVAVVGSGDSGRTAIEALCGQGPNMGLSVASLDYPDRIDWYGLPQGQDTREEWEKCNRSRYRGIGRLMPTAANPRAGRIYRMDRAQSVGGGFEGAYVNERPYDLVILCTGYTPEVVTMRETYTVQDARVGGRVVGQRVPDEDIFSIGVAARLPILEEERNASPALADVPENSTSLFRYAGRTAGLAAALKKPNPDEVPLRDRDPEIKATFAIRSKNFGAAIEDLADTVARVAKPNESGARTGYTYADGNPILVGDEVQTDTGRTGIVRGQATARTGGKKSLDEPRIVIDTGDGVGSYVTGDGAVGRGFKPPSLTKRGTPRTRPGVRQRERTRRARASEAQVTGGEVGTELPIQYGNGEPVRVGDRVSYIQSDRFGNGQGNVVGCQPPGEFGDGRVIIDIDATTASNRDNARDSAARQYAVGRRRVALIQRG